VRRLMGEEEPPGRMEKKARHSFFIGNNPPTLGERGLLRQAGKGKVEVREGKLFIPLRREDPSFCAAGEKGEPNEQCFHAQKKKQRAKRREKRIKRGERSASHLSQQKDLISRAGWGKKKKGSPGKAVWRKKGGRLREEPMSCCKPPARRQTARAGEKR